MFSPDENLKLAENSGVITMAALEQLGGNYKLFIDYLLQNSPKICVHMEPLVELYDENLLFDYLAIKFHRQRNYLSNFLSYLRKLENESKIKIMKVHRCQIGNLYHEGYSYVIWEPRS